MLVHKQFRQQFEQLNGKEYLEWEAEMRMDQVPEQQRSGATVLDLLSGRVRMK